MGKFSFWAIIVSLATTTILNSCKKGNNNSSLSIIDTMPAIGAEFGGGKLAYVLQQGDPGYDPKKPHGLIVAPDDQSTGIVWFNGNYIITNATGKAIGTGISNTNAIFASQGGGSYAASICKSLSLGGYNDWYLPSLDELHKLYINRSLIGGFPRNTYWSSSEINDSNAWGKIMFTGGQAIAQKDITNHVRAVRSF